MKFRNARTTANGRFVGRPIRQLAALFGFLLLMTVAAPQAQAAVRPPNDDDGSFYAVLRNQVTNKCADLPNYGSVGLNTPVTQYKCYWGINGDNQVWDFIPVGGGAYIIKNYKSGLCLDLPNYGYNPPGTHVSVYTCAANPDFDNQEWTFEDVGAGWEIHSVASRGLCLDVANWADGSDLANGLPLTIYHCFEPDWNNMGYDDHVWSLDSYDPAG